MKQFETTITKNYRICIAIWRIKWGKKSYELQTTQSHKINRNEQNFWKWWIKTDCCTADKHQINWNAKETRRFGWCFCAKCLSCREMVLFFSQYFCFRRMFYFWKSFLCMGLKKMIVALEHAKRYDFSSYVQSRNGVRSQLTALHCLFFFRILMYLFVIVYRSNLCSMHSECTAHNFVMPASSLNGAKWNEKIEEKRHTICCVEICLNWYYH